MDSRYSSKPFHTINLLCGCVLRTSANILHLCYIQHQDFSRDGNITNHHKQGQSEQEHHKRRQETKRILIFLPLFFSSIHRFLFYVCLSTCLRVFLFVFVFRERLRMRTKYKPVSGAFQKSPPRTMLPWSSSYPTIPSHSHRWPLTYEPLTPTSALGMLIFPVWFCEHTHTHTNTFRNKFAFAR